MKKCWMMLVLILCINELQALKLTLQPLMPSQITNANIWHYDIEAKGTGPTMFIIYVLGDTQSYDKSLVVRYKILVNSVAVGEGWGVAYEGKTNPFSLASNEQAVVTSNQFLVNSPDNTAKFYRSQRIQKLELDELKQRILSSGNIPTGQMRFQMMLEDLSGNVLSQDEFQVEILNVSKLELIAPGSEGSGNNQDAAVIFTTYPVFTWTSDLYNGIYQDLPVFEIKIFSWLSGQSVEAALQARPHHTAQVSENVFSYPSGARPLEKGNAYLWQVTGILRGLMNGVLSSKIYAFRVSEDLIPENLGGGGFSAIGNDVSQALSALGMILNGSGYEEWLNQFQIPFVSVKIQMDGQASNVEVLQNLANTFLSGNYQIKRVIVE